MRKPILALGAIVGLAGLWSAGWFAGKILVVEPEADAAIEQLRSGDVFLSFDERRIGGFPLSYDVSYHGVRMSDATSAWTWTVPWMRLSAGLEEVGGVVATAAPESALTVAAAVFGGAVEDAPVDFAVKSEDLVMVLTGAGDDGAARLNAASLSAAQGDAIGVLSGASVSIEGLTAAVRINDEKGNYAGEIDAATAAIAYRMSVDGVNESRTSTTMRGLDAAFAITALTDFDLARFIAEDGAANFTIRSDSYEGEGGSSGGPSQPPIDVSYKGANTTVDIAIADGKASYRGGAGPIGTNIKIDAPGFPGGAVDFAEIAIAMEMPLRKADGAEPYDFKVKIGGAEIDPAIWATFDPAEKLTRGPIDMVFDVGGVARVLTDFSGDGPPIGPPIDLETLEIDDVSLAALGVDARATGRLDIAGDASRPDGEVTLEVRGALALVDQLVAAGILPPEAASAYSALALQFARRGDGDDHLISDIVSRNGAITVNGVPIAQ